MEREEGKSQYRIISRNKYKIVNELSQHLAHRLCDGHSGHGIIS